MKASGTPQAIGGSGGRDEDEGERLTRNFNELLQELRVTQTGVQILTGFLLTVPFTQRFPDLDGTQTNGYLLTLVGAVLTAALFITPVALHRALFRKGEKDWLVEATDWCARSGLATLALTLAGVLWLVFDVVLSRTAGIIAGVTSLVVFVCLWGVFPLTRRIREAEGRSPADS